VSITITLLLIVSIGTIIPVNADTDTDITVITTGDVQVKINTDGTVSLYYNGVNIQAEINNLYGGLNGISLQMNALVADIESALSSVWLQMNTRATKTSVSNLNQTVFQLIGELDAILEDLFGRTQSLAYVIGLGSNSSIVTTNLKAGTQTVGSYLDSIITTLDYVADDINVLDKTLSEVYTELQAFEVYVEEQFNATYHNFNMTALEIENLADYTEEQRNLILSQITTLEKATESFVNAKVLELNELRESLRQDVFTDLITLESLIQVETDRQDFTEAEVQNLQQRLYDVENVLGMFVLISIVLAIILVAVAIKRKLRKPKPLQ